MCTLYINTMHTYINIHVYKTCSTVPRYEWYHTPLCMNKKIMIMIMIYATSNYNFVHCYRFDSPAAAAPVPLDAAGAGLTQFVTVG